MSESVIADDLHIKGELTTNGDVELKGSLEGEIVCRTLMVSEDARIEGSAAAEKVVIRGTVEGTIN
jgi:cytoskeletal protein CcmA (bactofilin family)